MEQPAYYPAFSLHLSFTISKPFPNFKQFSPFLLSSHSQFYPTSPLTPLEPNREQPQPRHLHRAVAMGQTTPKIVVSAVSSIQCTIFHRCLALARKGSTNGTIPSSTTHASVKRAADLLLWSDDHRTAASAGLDWVFLVVWLVVWCPCC